jgi:Sulfotransferase family
VTTFVFLISNGRSGSSLVQEILCRHPNVAFISNIEDRIPSLPPSASRFNNPLYRRVPPTLTRKGRIRFAPSEAYRIISRQVSAMVADSVRDLVESDAMPWVARKFRSFFEQRALAQGRDVFLHKFTGWPRTGFTRAIFPEARFINVVRDGRSVVASTLRSFWGWPGFRGPEHLHSPLPPAYLQEWEASGRSFPLLSGLVWKMRMEVFAEARNHVPSEQWLDIRFEDVLDDPNHQFKLMLEFMGLPADKRFDAALAKIDFQTNQKESFRSELDPHSVSLLERSLGEQLRTWGYK